MCVCVENEFCFGHTAFKETVKARVTYLSSQLYMYLELGKIWAERYNCVGMTLCMVRRGPWEKA